MEISPRNTGQQTSDGADQAPAVRSRVRRARSHAAARARRNKMLTYGLLILSGMLMVNALIGEKGLLANLQARQEFQEGSEDLRQLIEDNSQLENKAYRLRTDPQALEDAAREDLGMIKPGETIIRLRNRPSGRN